jgi:two-component system, cell cycle sensor histidine kinase and response regulator CckA
MPLAALHIASAFLDFLAAGQSLAFVWKRRLGRVWLLVFLALLVKGSLSVGMTFTEPASRLAALNESQVPLAELFVSLLMASGFVLTGQWFGVKERLEARFQLIAEVDRSLVGALEEERILSTVCDVLSRREGYRLAWVGVGEPDGSIRVERSAGEATAFLGEVAFRWDGTPSGDTPPGISLRTGETRVLLPGEPVGKAFGEGCRRNGLRSCASTRIDQHGFPHKVLTVHAGTARAFDALETGALEAMAHRVGTAIQSARRHDVFVNAKTSYDELLRHLRDGVLLVREGKVVRANPAVAAMLGYASPGLLFDADPASILAVPGALPEVRDALRAPFPRGPSGEWEAPVIRRDGSTFTAEIAITWVSRENRKESFVPERRGPLGMVLVRDVTQKVRTLHDLRKERDFSSQILDISGALILKLGTGGEIELFNRQCEEVTGVTTAEALGRSMPDLLIVEEARALHRAAIADVAGGKSPTRLTAAGGELRTIAWHHAPLRDGAGNIVSVVVTGIDVTERRLLERQIIEMQKMEAVGTLAGGIAHDFNNILTGILGNLDLAQRRVGESSPVSAPIGECIRAAERAAQLIRQLLDFSRRSPSERHPVSLGKVVREVVALFSQTIDRRIEVTSSIDEGLFPAFVDPNQVHQVLMNLCVNARDAIMESLDAAEKSGNHPLTGYWIYIRAENAVVDDDYCRLFPYARKGRYIRLSIGDNGAGMDETTQRRVFEPFFTTKKMGRGTGLGLSTVYGIVKQHNGWINLESMPGKGTTFCAYFPEAVGAREEERARREPERPARGKETVLFVDDEDLIRDLGRQVLEANGYTVYLAEDGKRAIELYAARRGKIDLVILDLTMPHRSGMEVFRAIRGLNPRAKVILSSGNMPLEPVEGAVFLPKPYRADVLTRTVRSVLDAPVPPL